MTPPCFFIQLCLKMFVSFGVSLTLSRPEHAGETISDPDLDSLESLRSWKALLDKVDHLLLDLNFLFFPNSTYFLPTFYNFRTTAGGLQYHSRLAESGYKTKLLLLSQGRN